MFFSSAAVAPEAALAAAPAPRDAPLQVGETFGRIVRYNAPQIVDFARLSFDDNPLHRSEQAARDAEYAGIIASGQQTAAMLMGMVASYFAREDVGPSREVVSLNFNFAFKAPIYASQDVTMRWSVVSVEQNVRLAGWIGQLGGTAACNGTDCVISRATVLVRWRDG